MPGERAIREVFAATPANGFFGFRLGGYREGQLEMSLPLRPEFVQEGGVVHGGIVSSLADTAAAYALVPALERGDTMTGVEFKVSFLTPAASGGGDLVARARVLRRGRRLGTVEVDVSQAGRAVARGLFTFLFSRPSGGGRPGSAANG